MEKKVDRSAGCKFSLTWETGDEHQVKRNQAVKLFMLHSKPNLIKPQIPRHRICTIIHLGTDKENLKNVHKSKQHLWLRHSHVTCIHVPINVHTCAMHACMHKLAQTWLGGCRADPCLSKQTNSEVKRAVMAANFDCSPVCPAACGVLQTAEQELLSLSRIH